MDVNGRDFQRQLSSILRAISTARFVAFDLELSGIPSRHVGHGKQTLQGRYEETKKAAERFQILQLGLTCAEEDKDRGEADIDVQPQNAHAK